MNREDILRMLRDFKRDHAEQYGIIEIGIFGSFARNDYRDDSDIDIVFETDKPNLFRTSAMRQKLEDVLGRHVDIVRLRERMNPRLRDRIVREALYV